MKTKKIASLLLAGLLALSVAACGQQPGYQQRPGFLLRGEHL